MMSPQNKTHMVGETPSKALEKPEPKINIMGEKLAPQKHAKMPDIGKISGIFMRFWSSCCTVWSPIYVPTVWVRR